MEMRRSYRGRLWLLIGLMTFLGGCAQQPTKADHGPGLNHVILLWLKEPGNLRQRAQVIEVTKELERLPGVEKIRSGEVIRSDRPIVDDSFDVGVHMLFRDEAALARYQDHPEHIRSLNQVIRPLVKKILIYDFQE